MSCKSTTEWVDYPPSTRVQRDSLPSILAGSEENVGIHYNFTDNGSSTNLRYSGNANIYLPTYLPSSRTLSLYEQNPRMSAVQFSRTDARQ